VPKLPADFVKAPVFDNPLRPTTGKLVIADGSKEVVVRFDAAEWAALSAASLKEGIAAEALVKQVIAEWLAHGPRVAAANGASAGAGDAAHAPRPKILAQLVGRVQEHLTSRFGWVRRILATAA
jgi:hypothetical protein